MERPLEARLLAGEAELDRHGAVAAAGLAPGPAVVPGGDEEDPGPVGGLPGAGRRGCRVGLPGGGPAAGGEPESQEGAESKADRDQPAASRSI